MIRKLEEVDGGQSPAAQEVPRDDAVRHRALVLSLVQLIDLELEEKKKNTTFSVDDIRGATW